MSKESLALVLRAQPDKKAAFLQITAAIKRLVILFQIPNFTEDNEFYLSEWIFDNYNCEPLELIIETLKNPPAIESTSWRLTPDTIKKWMAVALENRALQLEKEHQALKPELKEEIPNVDYESFKKRIIDGALPENNDVPWYKKPDYLEFKAKRIAELAKKNNIQTLENEITKKTT